MILMVSKFNAGQPEGSPRLLQEGDYLADPGIDNAHTGEYDDLNPPVAAGNRRRNRRTK